MMQMRPLALFGVLMISACDDKPPTDYAQRFPLSVQGETVVLPLPVGNPQAPFANIDERGLALLAGGYLERGNGPLNISIRHTAGSDEARARLLLDTAHDRLVAAG